MGGPSEFVCTLKGRKDLEMLWIAMVLLVKPTGDQIVLYVAHEVKWVWHLWSMTSVVWKWILLHSQLVPHKRKFLPDAKKKEKYFFDNLPVRSVNHCTFSMSLNHTRSRDRFQFLCSMCVCVLCINRTCGSTYHGLFIWGISLPALLTTLWLVGF